MRRGQPATSRAGRTARALVFVLAACGGAARPTPARPSDAVLAELARAETAERARRHDEARVHYERAIAIAHDPASHARARRDFGETLMTWGELAEARVQLDAAVAADPQEPSAWHNLGLLRHKLGDDAGAIAALERARTLAPASYQPRVALAALRWKRGDRDGAAAEYRALLELDLPARLRDKVQWALRELAKP